MRRLCLVFLCTLFAVPILSFAKDPADYPLSVHILHTQWNRDRYGIHHGWGRGNVKEGDLIRGFEFTYDGCEPIHETVSPEKYPGKWKKPQREVELLIAEVGEVKQYETCKLKTTLIEGVYMRGPGGITALTQEQFKAWRARRQQGAPYSVYPSDTPSTTAGVPLPTSTTRLTLSSTPEGADIEVDGKFLGNTPSALTVTSGDHQITIRKKGYKEWSRKMTIVTGSVNVIADLEQSTAP